MSSVPLQFDTAQFCFGIVDDRFIMSCPAHVYDLDRVREALGSSGIFNYQVDSAGFLRLWGSAGSGLHRALLELFAHINSYPRYFENDFFAFRNSGNPLVSCVILLTRNDLFVKNHLIPSIIKNSGHHDIEIIIVYNGFECDLAPFAQLTLLESEFLSVARAYNKGVLQGRGRYIALFHDDCLLADDRWIEKAIQDLDGHISAVTGQFEDDTAKCTPLVMKKQAFLDLGGFDENYRGGNEDRDLTYTIKSRGEGIGVNIGALHFQGVSTVLVFSKEAWKYKAAAAYNALPPYVWRQLSRRFLGIAAVRGVDAVIAHDMLYFNQKFKRLLFTSEEQFLTENARFTAMLEEHKHSPLLHADARTKPDLLEMLRS